MDPNKKRCPHCGGSGYAEGGEVRREYPDSDLGDKPEADVPEADDPGYQLDVYRGENVKHGRSARDFARDLRREKRRRAFGG